MKLRIIFKSFEKESLELCFVQFRDILLQKFQNKYFLIGAVSLPTRIKKFCVLRSPHVDKDSREQYEYRLYKKFFDLEVKENFEIFDDILNIEIPTGISISVLRIKSDFY
jgi:small subunit ribosomal protein S10